jgi:thiamine biosynthesis lipoprotein
MQTHRFAAMGTEIELMLDANGGEDVLDAAEQEFRRLESLLSRFRPDSELSRLNEAGSATVAPELLELIELALAARDHTGGRFDPTVHNALTASGYDRSFEHLPRDRESGRASAQPTCNGRVTVDATNSTVELDHGVRLDLGGIAKGWAADRVLASLRPLGPALVNAGGDIAATGRPWPVGVQTPGGPITLELRDGALATSGRDRRHWHQNGRLQHHVIDPRTALPAEGDLLTVTAGAPTAAKAETIATSLFLAGDAARATAEADELGVAAVLVTRGGRTILAGGLA